MKTVPTGKPVRLFVSYSHENRPWFGRLMPLLQFRSTKVAHAWHDQKLQAGNQWDLEIKRELDQMDVFICLVSYEFLASKYIKNVELPRALKRCRKGEVEILPIILFPVDLEKEYPRLNKFNPLPAFDSCWSAFEQNGGYYQNAHKPIREGILDAINRVRQNLHASE